MLRDCPRQAFFEYYSDREPESSQAWNLKELVTLPMMAGDVVDLIVAAALKLKSQEKSPPKPLSDAGRNQFLKFVARSPEIVARMRVQPRTYRERRSSPFKPLHQDWYGYDVGLEYVERMAEQVSICLATFENSEIYARLLASDPATWGPFTRSERERPHFDLAGLRVYASFDFYCRDGDSLTIFDWKTGRAASAGQDAARRQLSVYALYGMRALVIPRLPFLPKPYGSKTTRSGNRSPRTTRR